MANQYVNHVIVNGSDVIDLRSDTVDAAHLAQGYTAHDKSGAPITGTMSSGGGLPSPIVAGDTPVLYSPESIYKTKSSTSLVATGSKITIPYDGTYRFKWGMNMHYNSTAKIYSRLYKNGVAVGTEESVAGGNGNYTLDLSCSAGDTVEVYAKGFKVFSANVGAISGLIACIEWDNGF